MAKQLRVLLIDDSEDDVLLVARELLRAGYGLTYRQVFTADSVRDAFSEPWDFVISDWSMPDGFTGLAAFQIMRGLGHDLPFVIVSGTIGEELAVDSLKAGVHDFMTKGKLARLAPTIERELRETAIRRRQREIDDMVAQQRRALESSERLLSEVLESVPEGVVFVDKDGRLLRRNTAAAELLGVPGTSEEYETWSRGTALYRTEAGGPLALEDRPISRALQGVAVSREHLFTSPGKRVWINISTRPLRTDGAITGAVATVRDLTAERAAQQQLMISDRMASVGMLAAGVAHEINNPLAAVLANLEMAALLCAKQGGPEAADVTEVGEMLSDARSAAERVRHIVKDLKVFSRHEDSFTDSVDLSSMLESTLRMAWNEVRHRATLVKNYGVTPPVRGSESRLGQVFLNLVVNAVQSIPDGNAERNEIRITTGLESPNCAFVDVTDTGAGMSAETLRKLFTPFFTTKPQGEGTGLGLAISHRIITSLGGSIRVSSTVGVGTTFRVVIPVSQAVAHTRVNTQRHKATTRRARILAIDDEPLITSAVRRILASEHDVDIATDATHALELLRVGPAYDLILCDLMMPQVTGMELYERVQAERPDHAERIVFMTGDAFTVAARAFLDEVPNQRIEKPFTTALLRELVAERLK